MFVLNPHDVGEKQLGRMYQCAVAGLDYKEAAQFFTEATPKNFQTHYNTFVSAYPKQSRIISNVRLTGIGPGEMIAYFLFDNVSLGGLNKPWDIYINGEGFAEMKGGRYNRGQHSIDDFKLGRDQDPSSQFIIKEASNTSATLRFTVDNKIVVQWKDMVFDEYLSEKNMSLIQTDTLQMRHF